MNTRITIIAAASLFTVGIVAAVQIGYVPTPKDAHTHSSTEFIEPSPRFVACEDNTDCIKIKGSACPPTEGGVEICINKNHFQEYISTIDEAAGAEKDIVCPQVIASTNRMCGCMMGKCDFQ